jgi:uncharacterized membrane protein YhaH (DUF805 family)
MMICIQCHRYEVCAARSLERHDGLALSIVVLICLIPVVLSIGNEMQLMESGLSPLFQIILPYFIYLIVFVAFILCLMSKFLWWLNPLKPNSGSKKQISVT